jgi:LysR family nod box-dependent transcriptional activator
MRFKGFDLNLLVALDALLSARSVTAAAERLHLSQPAMSAALNRLREALDDEILVPHGKRMVATVYAEQLHAAVQDLLVRIEGAVSLSTHFNPDTSERQFRIAASDYITEVLLVPVMREIVLRAPRIGIRLVPPAANVAVPFQRGEIDLIIAPKPYLMQEHPCELLFDDRFVLVGWAENPAFQTLIDRDVFFAHGHIAVEFGQDRERAYSEWQMARYAKQRRVEIVVPAFNLVAPMLIGTRRMALMHERLALAQAQRLPLAIAPNPFDFPLLEEWMQNHESRGRDAGLDWLKAVIKQVAAGQLPGKL